MSINISEIRQIVIFNKLIIILIWKKLNFYKYRIKR